VTTECTELCAHAQDRNPEVWQSWGSVARYLVARLAETGPTVAMLWVIYVHR
jgi:hypothetical protein